MIGLRKSVGACSFALLFCSSSHAYAQAALNLAPACASATAAPVLLDPADDRMVPVAISVSDPDGHPVTLITQCIQQSEPAEYWSDGTKVSGDGSGIGTAQPAVRAKRLSNFTISTTSQYYRSNGRIYDIIFKAKDTLGAECVGKVSVEAPLYLDSYKNPDAATQDFGLRFPSSTAMSNCGAVPINNPPIIYSEPVVSANSGASYQYPVKGHDPDAESLQYVLVSGPAGMQLDAATGLLEWTPATDQVGEHPVVVKAVDAGGLEATQTFTIAVTSISDVSVSIIANPTSGQSPLTVRFSPAVKNNNIVITQYSWDFQGDGVIDESDPFGQPTVYTYSGAPGATFEAALTVKLSSGETLTAKKAISLSNQAPSVTVNSTTTNGHAPLQVAFNITAQDPQGVARIEIDFEGDGTYDQSNDFTASTTASAEFATTYQTEGVFVARVKVTDAVGAVTEVSNNAISVDVNNPQDPIITLSGTPLEGAVPLQVTLTASASLHDGSSTGNWSWDLDGDGVYETAGGSDTTDSVTALLDRLDYYYPVAKFVTSSNREAMAAMRIKTLSTALPTLAIPNVSDTINLDALEMADFTVNLPYRSNVSITIEDASGALTKTLASKVDTPAGVSQYVWDGTNDSEQFVAEGDYYVVIGYAAYGSDRKVDLRTSTGGTQTFYTRKETNPRTFDRLEKPMAINYEVADPAEVTFFWQVSFGDRLMNLMEHERMGRGAYTLYWNGEYPSGKKVPDNLDALMPGILRYTLPENVIFVKEDPRILDFKLKSTVMADPRREPIAFDLVVTRASTVELVVSDMQKGVDVATRTFADVAPGSHSFEWDGKNDDNQLLAPGDYRIGVRSIDERGKRSLFWYRTQRIAY